MIAAGVTGMCTNDASKIPDIRKYEALDLVAASFLYEYAHDPDLDPEEAKQRACRRWFGNDDGSGAPNPPKAEDKQIICALAQTDLFFVPTCQLARGPEGPQNRAAIGLGGANR